MIAEAVTWYSQAIAGAPLDHSLFGNRSAAHLALDEPDAALLDAKKAVKLKGTWPKGYYRYTGTPLLHTSYGQVSGLVHRFLLL